MTASHTTARPLFVNAGQVSGKTGQVSGKTGLSMPTVNSALAWLAECETPARLAFSFGGRRVTLCGAGGMPTRSRLFPPHFPTESGHGGFSGQPRKNSRPPKIPVGEAKEKATRNPRSCARKKEKGNGREPAWMAGWRDKSASFRDNSAFY